MQVGVRCPSDIPKLVDLNHSTVFGVMIPTAKVQVFSDVFAGLKNRMPGWKNYTP